VFSLETTTGYDATPGAITSTGRNLDVAVKGNSWLTVQALDGTEAYTRGGSLQTDAEGNLVTTAGLTVLGDAGPVQVPRDTVVSFAPDGTISGTDGLCRPAGGELAADPDARLTDGALESSNVSAVETMVAMIAAARQFEAQMKMLSTAESNEKAAAQLLSVS
jgi:flagellar basal-body rod protein FlgF